jgi:hypothetical protein
MMGLSKLSSDSGDPTSGGWAAGAGDAGWGPRGLEFGATGNGGLGTGGSGGWARPGPPSDIARRTAPRIDLDEPRSDRSVDSLLERKTAMIVEPRLTIKTRRIVTPNYRREGRGNLSEL